MTYQKCNNCNGSGTILNHQHYSHSGQRSAGQGMSVCPACNGSGNNGALDLSSKKYSGKSPGEIQGEKIGEGCATVIFSITPYLIVLYILFNVIDNSINMLSSTFSFDFPEWLPGFATLTVFGVVLFYKRYIGLMAIFGVAIIVASILISEFGGNLKFELGKNATKQIPKGCSICQNVIKDEARITKEYKAFFKLTPEIDKERFILSCSGIKDYCRNSHSINW